jgi:hypothetical protein
MSISYDDTDLGEDLDSEPDVEAPDPVAQDNSQMDTIVGLMAVFSDLVKAADVNGTPFPNKEAALDKFLTKHGFPPNRTPKPEKKEVVPKNLPPRLPRRDKGHPISESSHSTGTDAHIISHCQQGSISPNPSRWRLRSSYSFRDEYVLFSGS